jgi:hypothetical protein
LVCPNTAKSATCTDDSGARYYWRVLEDLYAAGCAVHPHPHAVAQDGRSGAGAGNAQQSQFAAHESGVAHGAADVGDHRFGQWEQRSPAGIARPAHQDGALVDIRFVEIASDMPDSLGYAGAHAHPFSLVPGSALAGAPAINRDNVIRGHPRRSTADSEGLVIGATA